MPCYFDICIKKIDITKLSPLFRIPTYETYEQYINEALPRIKNTHPEVTLLMCLIYRSLLIKCKLTDSDIIDKGKLGDILFTCASPSLEYLQELVRNTPQNNYVQQAITMRTLMRVTPFFNNTVSDIFYENSDYIIVRSATTHTGSSGMPKYTLWYFPRDFEITNFVSLMDILIAYVKTYYNSGCTSYKNKQMDTLGYNIIKKSTNFDEIYQSSRFIHNLRHLTNDDKRVIDEFVKTTLLKILTSEKKISLHDYHSLASNKYAVYVHYPNGENFNIFHLHMVPSDIKDININEEKYYNYYEHNKNHRTFIWDKQIMNIDRTATIQSLYAPRTMKSATYEDYVNDEFYGISKAFLREYYVKNISENTNLAKYYFDKINFANK